MSGAVWPFSWPRSVQVVETGQGARVEIDHERRTISGTVAVPSAGRCPHFHTVHDHEVVGTHPKHGDVVRTTTSDEQCIGGAGHLGDNHADRLGNLWPVKRKDRSARRDRRRRR